MGFVPNSYKWPCIIQFIEASKTNGKWDLNLGWTNAQRSFGNAPLTVIN
ncbi:hypothetical protein LCGC14_1890450 [marine sediment metagenome]|uniref:Uncharacterized protein n=1 Tax=marine sediment metagenome TaxID=412755 RepID=A0A0F9IDJ4_9ZZZZ